MARLDVELARRGLAVSREAAQRLIMAGKVRVNSRPAQKPDLKVDEDSKILVVGGERRYASRGAEKLIAALDEFQIEVANREALDVGASSGGFTDALLSRGAARVIALDVGYGQLDLRLRNDPRVTVLERTNIREVALTQLPFQPNLIAVDVSFISLRLVIPVLKQLLTRDGNLIALIKPQFEVGKGKVGKGGVVRDPELRAEAVTVVVDFAKTMGFAVKGQIESPLRGPAGYVEYLAWMKPIN